MKKEKLMFGQKFGQKFGHKSKPPWYRKAKTKISPTEACYGQVYPLETAIGKTC